VTGDGVRRALEYDWPCLVFVVPVRTDQAHPQLPAEGQVWRPLRSHHSSGVLRSVSAACAQGADPLAIQRWKTATRSGDPVNGSRHDNYCLGESGALLTLDPKNWVADKGYVGNGMITPFKKPAAANYSTGRKSSTPRSTRSAGLSNR